MKKTINFTKIKNNGVVIVIILIGIIFMLLSDGGDKREPQAREEKTEIKTDDEERLRKILSEIKGVGSVSVMVTYYGGVETELAYETSIKSSRDEEAIEENSENRVVTSSGEPIVKRFIYPRVKGVVVAAEGAGDSTVLKSIKSAVTTAMGVAPYKVCVVEKIK